LAAALALRDGVAVGEVDVAALQSGLERQGAWLGHDPASIPA
jgi:hypothetical protein